jgi:hypothetical protein
MNTTTNIVAVAAILTTLAVSGIASAHAIYLPSSCDRNQMETIIVPTDARFDGNAGTCHPNPHAPRPYGQW